MNKKNKEDLSKYRIGKAVSIISHQLKTPLAIIKGYLEILLSGDLGELNKKQREYLTAILETNQRAMDFMKTILDVTQIETDKIEMRSELTDLVILAKEVVNNFSFFARAHNCEIIFQPSKNVFFVFIDKEKIKGVMNNIISNAIIYNKGKGKIEVSLFKKGKQVVFSCKDNGIGINKKEKEKIFSKFYRSEEAVVINPRGSGLGLFIARAIIEKSGGKIWFESKKNKGSIFYFSLPLVKKDKI